MCRIAHDQARNGSRNVSLSDARNSQPRIGHVLARGRDAADVPICNVFGTHTLA
jgi:hypothetical protein